MSFPSSRPHTAERGALELLPSHDPEEKAGWLQLPPQDHLEAGRPRYVVRSSLTWAVEKRWGRAWQGGTQRLEPHASKGANANEPQG